MKVARPVRAVAVFVCLAALLGPGASAESSRLDPSFGDAGIVVTDLGGSDDGRAVAVDAWGRVLALGSTDSDYAFARYTRSGILDRSFGSAGVRIVDVGPVDDARDLVIGGRGVILAAGVTDGNVAVLRLEPDGAVDTRFGSAGVAVADFDPLTDDEPYGLEVQRDGKIVVAGVAGGAFGVARFLPTGRPDPGFGGDGMVQTDVRACCWDVAFDVAVQPDGRIIAAGASVPVAGGRGGDVAMVRYTPRGELDRSFGDEGIVITDIDAGPDAAFALALQADGRPVLAGLSGGRLAVLRYSRGGRPDPSFGSGGAALVDVGPLVDLGSSLVLRPDGRIVAAGMVMRAPEAGEVRRRSDFVVARLTARGRPDDSFGRGGVVTTSLGGFHQIVAAAGQSDGRVVVVGRSAPAEDLILARYLP